MSAHNFKVGTALVVDEHVSRVEREEILRLEDGRVYRPTKVPIFPRTALLPRKFIEAGYIPNQYKPYMVKGIHTTNHDSIGSDRWVQINGRDFSARYLHKGTVAKLNFEHTGS